MVLVRVVAVLAVRPQRRVVPMMGANGACSPAAELGTPFFMQRDILLLKEHKPLVSPEVSH